MIKNSLLLCLVLVFIINTSKAQNENQIFAKVNSEYNEQTPVLSPDRQTLFFTRSHHVENTGGILDKGDIWYSQLLADKTWSAPKNAKSLNNHGWNGVIGFSADGKSIYLHNHYTEQNGLVRTQGIAKAIKSGSGWSVPVDIAIPYFKNLAAIPGGSISADGKTLVLSIESYGTKGGEDIYVCIRQDNGLWGEPKNLGSIINTKYQEFSPYLTADNRTLYFASNGLGGQGSSDIFVSERLDDSWTNWSQPRPLQEVNSKGRERDYRPYEGFAIYSSTINSDGYNDLKIHIEKPKDSVIQVIAEVVVSDTTINENTEVEKELAEVQFTTITIYGKVLDAKTMKEIGAIVKVVQGVTNFEKEVPTNNENGNYSLSITGSGKYDIQVDAPGYISIRETLDVDSASELKHLEVDFALQPIAVGITVNLKDVLFEQSTSKIIETSYDELNLVVDLMKQNPSMKIRLEGHTDNRGVAKHNQRLSKTRAEAVEEYLVKQGISPKRLSRKGYGGSRPIADNENPTERKLNRRVEFTIISQ